MRNWFYSNNYNAPAMQLAENNQVPNVKSSDVFCIPYGHEILAEKLIWRIGGCTYERTAKLNSANDVCMFTCEVLNPDRSAKL